MERDAKDEPGDENDDAPAVDEDAAWQQLVADFDSTDASGDDHPWPDAEDVDPDEEPSDDDAEPKRPKVTVIDLDTDDTETPDDDEHYVKPDPPTLPKGDVWTKAAWGVMFAAVAYTIAAVALNWDVPKWSYAIAVVVFIAGIVTHVLRIRLPRSDDTDHGDGAVV